MPRKDDRVAFITEILLEWSSGRREARITDLSAGGCYIDTIVSIPESTAINIELRAADGRSMRFDGDVAYSLPGMGIGVKFTDLTDERKAFLASILPAI